ncbi:ATP-binding protein [Listeria booriae]|uniref:ATP-binding protein n=1 Tax=Listeria booriae TaxID=1552123 RepID=UPI001629759E|nr:ATP-binding protein [Listeria booriae]MBC1247327.1 ATP-binding protein [Listeria booriae]
MSQLQPLAGILDHVIQINSLKDCSDASKVNVQYSDSFCNSEVVHPLKKDVRKLIIDGTLTCPLCKSHDMNLAFQKEQEEKIRQYRAQFQNGRLQADSLFSDYTIEYANFEAYETIPESEAARNKERAIMAMKKYKEGVIFNTMISGHAGVGKSHLAMAILNNLNAKLPKTCLFIKVDNLMREIRKTFKPSYQGTEDEEYYINRLVNADFLVLDDLGAESGSIQKENAASDFVHRVMYGVLDGRRDKSTIITTNLSVKGIQQLYDEKLISRMLSNHYIIKFENTSDHRIQSISFD